MLYDIVLPLFSACRAEDRYVMYPGGWGEELNWKKPTTRGYKCTRDSQLHSKVTYGNAVIFREDTGVINTDYVIQLNNSKTFRSFRKKRADVSDFTCFSTKRSEDKQYLVIGEELLQCCSGWEVSERCDDSEDKTFHIRSQKWTLVLNRPKPAAQKRK